MSSVTINGPIAYRIMKLAKGEIVRGHTHNFDHSTLLLEGMARIRWWDAAGKEYLTEVHRSHAVRFRLIRAGVEQEIEGMEDGTLFYCIYPHRDSETAEVVEHYTGWDAAYV